jgi:hypothetical protein
MLTECIFREQKIDEIFLWLQETIGVMDEVLQLYETISMFYVLLAGFFLAFLGTNTIFHT